MRGIAVLGPVRVIGDDGTPARVGSPRQCLLLAVLSSVLPTWRLLRHRPARSPIGSVG